MKIDQAKVRYPTNSTSKGNHKINQRVSTYTETYKDEYYNLEIEKLIPYKNQARKVFEQDSIDNLAKTIKEYGIRQPLTVLPSENEEGRYEIVSGERRWRAARIAGLTKVPCLILQNEKSVEEIALIENIQRENLHPLELMQSFQNLLNKKIYKSQDELAKKLGMNRTTVAEIISLSRLPLNTQNLLLEKKVKSRRIFRKLLKLPDAEHQELIDAYEEKNDQKISKTPFFHKKKKLFSIYIEDGNIISDERQAWNLTADQKNNLSNYLKDLIAKI